MTDAFDGRNRSRSRHRWLNPELFRYFEGAYTVANLHRYLQPCCTPRADPTTSNTPPWVFEHKGLLGRASLRGRFPLALCVCVCARVYVCSVTYSGEWIDGVRLLILLVVS